MDVDVPPNQIRAARNEDRAVRHVGRIKPDERSTSRRLTASSKEYAPPESRGRNYLAPCGDSHAGHLRAVSEDNGEIEWRHRISKTFPLNPY